jgi:two-component system sensor histidine kinase BaeS
MGPRSLGARLFLAIVGVSVVALALGAWFVERALRLEVKEEVTIARPVGASPGPHVDRQVTTTQAGPQGPALSQRLALALAILLVGATATTAWLARRIVQPVAALRVASERMARGDHTARVDVRGHDEVAGLGRAFNRMADQISSEERQRRDLTNDIAHELRTPLTNLRCHLEALADGITPFTTEGAHTLLSDVLHLQHVVEDVADLARADAGQLALTIERVALEPVIDGLAREIGPRLAGAHISLVKELQPSLPHLRADSTRLAQVLRNLIDNAIAHTPAGGRIRIGATASRQVVTITVSDTGPGIPVDQLDRIFERFYRTDPSRARTTGGAGLGLAIVRQLVRLHDGDIHAENVPGAGAAFVVTWPTS